MLVVRMSLKVLGHFMQLGYGTDEHEIEGAILSQHLYKNTGKGYTAQNKKGSQKPNQDEERIWFCSAYQRNKCPNKSNHMVVIKGTMRMTAHICATC